MKKILFSLTIIAVPLFAGDAQKIIKELEKHQPTLMDCPNPKFSSGNIIWKNCTIRLGSGNKDIYNFFKATPSTEIDSWYKALEQAEQFIKKNNPGILQAFYKAREESNVTINAMKTIYNHTMKEAGLEGLLGADRTFRDKKSLESAEKLLEPIKKMEEDAYDCHLNFPKKLKELDKSKAGFFNFKKKNEDKAILVLERVKDIVAQHILMLMQSFSLVKESFETK